MLILESVPRLYYGQKETSSLKEYQADFIRLPCTLHLVEQYWASLRFGVNDSPQFSQVRLERTPPCSACWKQRSLQYGPANPESSRRGRLQPLQVVIGMRWSGLQSMHTSASFWDCLRLGYCSMMRVAGSSSVMMRPHSPQVSG